MATDIDAVSLEYAVKNVSRNDMEGRIRGGKSVCTHQAARVMMCHAVCEW